MTNPDYTADPRWVIPDKAKHIAERLKREDPGKYEASPVDYLEYKRSLTVGIPEAAHAVSEECGCSKKDALELLADALAVTLNSGVPGPDFAQVMQTAEKHRLHFGFEKIGQQSLANLFTPPQDPRIAKSKALYLDTLAIYKNENPLPTSLSTVVEEAERKAGEMIVGRAPELRPRKPYPERALKDPDYEVAGTINSADRWRIDDLLLYVLGKERRNFHEPFFIEYYVMDGGDQAFAEAYNRLLNAILDSHTFGLVWKDQGLVAALEGIGASIPSAFRKAVADNPPPTANIDYGFWVSMGNLKWTECLALASEIEPLEFCDLLEGKHAGRWTESLWQDFTEHFSWRHHTYAYGLLLPLRRAVETGDLPEVMPLRQFADWMENQGRRLPLGLSTTLGHTPKATRNAGAHDTPPPETASAVTEGTQPTDYGKASNEALPDVQKETPGSTNPHTVNTPKGATWADLTWKFADRTHAVIQWKDREPSGRLHFSDLGFQDRRKKSSGPVRAWGTLRVLATAVDQERRGKRVTDPGKLKEPLKAVRKNLNRLFPRLAGDPIPRVRGKGYRPQFTLQIGAARIDSDDMSLADLDAIPLGDPRLKEAADDLLGNGPR